MRELLPDLERWLRAGTQSVLGRVVRVEGSSPREVGAAMAVSADGEVVGSVSGGCVEGAVVEAARSVLAGRMGPHMVSFGYSDDEAFAVGLTCGGTLHLFIEPAPTSSVCSALREAVEAHTPVALATLVEGPELGSKLLIYADPERMPNVGSLGDAELTRVVARDARSELVAGRSVIRHYGQAAKRAGTRSRSSSRPSPRRRR